MIMMSSFCDIIAIKCLAAVTTHMSTLCSLCDSPLPLSVCSDVNKDLAANAKLD